MNNEKIVLGLDIGIGSVGWGLVKLTEEKYVNEKTDGTTEEKFKISDGQIIDAGVRTFQLPQDRQQKSLAFQRGTARRCRKTIKRKAQRLKRLIKLAKKFDLIQEDFTHDQILKPAKKDNIKEKWDIWQIRKEALERKLSDIELFRVLYHIAKHRGFHFRTKSEEMEKEDTTSETGKARAGIARVTKKLNEGNWETVGQMFWEEFKQTNPENKRKRNAKDKYENSIPRVLLKGEIETIFDKQQKFDNPRAKDELKQRYIEDILMYEEGIDDNKLQNMMSQCEFIKDMLCAPKESYTSERFTFFNRLNVLELIDTQNRDRPLPLDEKQRRKIEALAYEKANGVTFAQIRTELGFEDDYHLRFNLCSYREKNPEYNKKLKCEIKNGELQFEEKHKMPIVNIRTGEVKVLENEIKNIFNSKKVWANSKKIHVYYLDIRKQLNLPGDYRFKDLSGYTKSAEEFGSEAKYVKQFEKETFIEFQGYHKIKKAIEENCGSEKWEQIKNDISKLDAIAEGMTYCKSDETRTKYLQEHGVTDAGIIDAVLTINMKQLASFSKEALSNLVSYMEKGSLFKEAKEKCGYGKTAYEKQAILPHYSGFFEKNPVVARVISQTRKLINALLRKYRDNYPIDQIHIEVSTELASSKKRKAQIAEGQSRYREDKKQAEERCREFGIDPEEGQNLLMFRLAEQQNNRCPYTNKAITFYPTISDNEVYIQDCEIDHIIPMSRSFNDSLNNKVLCAQQANQNKKDRIPFEWFENSYGKDSQQWMEFQRRVEKMYGMPYSRRKNFLRKSWTEKDKEEFISRNLNDNRYAARHIAEYLRKYFDFSKSKREDVKESSRIQLRSGGVTAFLRHMWGLSKKREENDLHHALDALVVACSTNGHVYLVSNLSKEIERKGKNWYKHFGRDKFRPWNNIREDIQNAVEKVFISRMPRHKVTGSAHDENPKSLVEERRIKKVNAKNPKKKIESLPIKNRTIKINGGYAEMGDIVRADIFTDDKGKNYVVPVYAVDIFSNRPLPDKYVPDDGELPYEQWPSVTEDNLKFRFSIFKDDLISINDTMYYVSFFEATTANVNVKNIDGSIFPDKENAQDPYTKKIGYRPKRKKGKCVLKKYSVDMLGNYKEVKQETRLGSKFENKKMR